MRKKILKTLAIGSACLILLLQIPNFSMAAIPVVTKSADKERLLGIEAQGNEVRNTRNCK